MQIPRLSASALTIRNSSCFYAAVFRCSSQQDPRLFTFTAPYRLSSAAVELPRFSDDRKVNFSLNVLAIEVLTFRALC
jgi:hypothetical protein